MILFGQSVTIALRSLTRAVMKQNHDRKGVEGNYSLLAVFIDGN